MNVAIPTEWRAASSRSTPRFVQRTVPVLDGDAPNARVFEAESDAYTEAIRLFADGKPKIDRSRMQIE